MSMDNPQIELAEAFVRDTGCHIFLTGKAGTGKTTFLHNLKKKSPKRMVVAAPTGVAAINAGGVTLHSFFQLPFGPFVPGSDAGARSAYRFSAAKINLIRSLDLLVIDEISMVRADLLDGVDDVLRRYRYSQRPFGGVQLLMIGDLFQLPPVVKEQEWSLLRPHYDSPYFFSSQALARTEMTTIELRHIYRQADSHFIDLLNRVRNNRVDEALLAQLNARCRSEAGPSEGDGTITLSTHNKSADAINRRYLEALEDPPHRFDAVVEGDFPEQAYPAAATLRLKPGAQVMFVKNDASPEKRYFNGKIGTIIRISGQDIHVACPEDEEQIVVEAATWENIEYRLDPKNQEITEKCVGTFRQVPLRLAWAITIHKSQGLTFDKAIIDAQAAFAYGQVYVALSRCRTLEGMAFSSSLSARAVRTDPVVARFSQQAREAEPSLQRLAAARSVYHQELLLECFDFGRLAGRVRRLVGMVLGNSRLVQVTGVADLQQMQEAIEDTICTVAERFQKQLQGIFPASGLPAEDAVVGERLAKAAVYFSEKLGDAPGILLSHLQVASDNQALKTKITRALKLAREEVAVKLAAVQACGRDFSPTGYFRAVSAAAVEGSAAKKAKPGPTYTQADIDHPELFGQLTLWRADKAAAEGVPHYRVMHQKTLVQIAVHLPDTLEALMGVKGIGKRLAERYGDELVALVAAYRHKMGVETVVLPAPSTTDVPQKTTKERVDTKQVTLDLFEQGMSPEQIAEQRGLVLTTIEGHLAHWVASGEVAIDRLVADEERAPIQQELVRLEGKPFAAVKVGLDDEVTYAQIKLVAAHLKYLSRQQEA